MNEHSHGDTARLYHRLTSYGAEMEFPNPPADHPLVLQDFVANDIPTWPPQYKRYGGERMPLPRSWEPVSIDATAVLGGRAVSPSRVELASLARVLFLSAGVVRTGKRSHGRTVLFRAAGSAGGRFPLELYVAARSVAGLADGVYWYDPMEHALVLIGPAADGATTLIATGIPWRTGWRYAERGFRHIYWDGGTMLAQVLAVAASAGWRPRLWTRFPDARVAEIVGADGVHEFPIALVTFGSGTPALQAGGEAATGTIDDRPVEFPLVTAAQRAGDLDELGEPWPPGDALGEAPPSRDLDAVILQRGSTRLMDPDAVVARDVYEFSLAASLRGIDVPHYVAALGVEGVEPGVYRWPDAEPLRRGDLREELQKVAWYQDLGGDAAFDVLGVVDLTGLGDRGYREAQLAAGIVEGRLHLAAYALGIGASGMTFLDSEIEALVGAPLAGLLMTCVGVPTYRSTDGGRPGAPIEVVTPTATGTLPGDEMKPGR